MSSCTRQLYSEVTRIMYKETDRRRSSVWKPFFPLPTLVVVIHKGVSIRHLPGYRTGSSVLFTETRDQRSKCKREKFSFRWTFHDICGSSLEVPFVLPLVTGKTMNGVIGSFLGVHTINLSLLVLSNTSHTGFNDYRMQNHICVN